MNYNKDNNQTPIQTNETTQPLEKTNGTTQPLEKTNETNKKNKTTQDSFFIYGNYEDEEGELAGDLYIKWSGLKAKATAKQFRSLVEKTKFLQNKIQILINTNKKLNEEIISLKKKFKKMNVIQ